MIEVVPATRELLSAFYGAAAEPTVQAWVVVEDGVPIGVGGLAFRRHFVEVFSDIRPEMRKHPVTLWRVARQVMRRAAELGRPAIAVRNPDEPTADAFLRRLGFQREGEVYLWRG